MVPSPPPPPVERAPLAQFLFDRGVKLRPAALALGCSYEQLRRVCLPVDDPDWRRASDKLRQKVQAWTGGKIGLRNWPERAGRAAELAP